MKKIILFLVLLSFPYSSFAGLDFYLSTQNLPYGKEVWTSVNYPDVGSSKIKVDQYFSREDVPAGYNKTSQEIKDLIDELFSTLTLAERQARYNSFIAFEKQNLAQYVAIALSTYTDNDIADKETNGFILTPFESHFKNCGINLVNRKTIVRNMITGIYNTNYTNIADLTYSDIRFWDCIIPFPDKRRGTSTIADSFPSNKLIAQSRSWSPLRFGNLENSVNLFSLAAVSLSGSYAGVQANNLLDLQSTRVETGSTFDKESGGSKILFVHQNYRINPFSNDLLKKNNAGNYTIGGTLFNSTHIWFIRNTDPEEKRTFSGWQEIQDGIYEKTLIQENTFTQSGSIYIPKQSVGVTTYYAVLYNYDTTPPVCPSTLFSHESAGNENFIFPEYPWFRTSKYGYFVCSEEESACLCDTSTLGCFLKDDTVLSLPQSIKHAQTFTYTFKNKAGLSQVCTSPADKKLFYDRISPDIHLILPGVPEASLIREYVSNEGVLYDGVQIVEKRFYHIKNDISFQADEELDIQLQLYDPYNNSKTQEWVSGINAYTVGISEFENNNWVKKIEQKQTFDYYNPLGTLKAQDTHILKLDTLAGIQDIITQVGSYQVYVDIEDVAGNQSRVVFYFDIIPASISTSRSLVEVGARETLFADNSSFYRYTLTLRDSYNNPVIGKQIGSISQSCVGVTVCSELQLDMTWSNPSGWQALEVFDLDTLSDVDGKLSFSVRALVPGVFTESFVLNVINPAFSVRLSGDKNTFLSPLRGILEAKVSSVWVADILPVDIASEYRVRIEDAKSLGYSWTLSSFWSYLRARHPDTDFALSGTLLTQADGVYFSGIFNSNLAENEKHKTLLEIVDDTVSGIDVSYLLGGKTVRYRLSSLNLSQEPLRLGNTRELQNPVKVIGMLQGVGNTHNLTERQNFTDISTSDLRSVFRKNIGANIKARVHNTTIWGIKYIDKTLDSNKNYVLENNPSFETLVVRNGNILIEDDFNTLGKPIGLVSYTDSGYNKEDGFKNVWNIYVEPEVKTISAFIYADGGFISTQSGKPISWDVATRNTILPDQLSLIGSLFTRNTLAWGRIFNGEYILPWWEKTTQQDLATQYDLYYTRRGNTNCEMDAYAFCNVPEYLIIEYDTRISSTPPKLFSN